MKLKHNDENSQDYHDNDNDEDDDDEDDDNVSDDKSIGMMTIMDWW